MDLEWKSEKSYEFFDACQCLRLFHVLVLLVVGTGMVEMLGCACRLSDDGAIAAAATAPVPPAGRTERQIMPLAELKEIKWSANRIHLIKRI